MKKIFLLLFTFFSFSYFFGQGNNLQFNQVLNFEYSSSFLTYSPINVGTITVPTDKIYKIVSGSAIRRYNGVDNLDHVKIQVGEHIVSGGDGSMSLNNCPIWLGSGTYNVFISASNSSDNLKGALSIVEFNIVQ
jgi:hypothetical protein